MCASSSEGVLNSLRLFLKILKLLQLFSITSQAKMSLEAYKQI